MIQNLEQTKTGSAIETIANTACGYLINYIILILILTSPYFKLASIQTQALGMTTIFTIVSLLRGYFIRRLFNRLNR